MPTNVSGSVSFAVHVCVSASLAANVNTVVAANFLSQTNACAYVCDVVCTGMCDVVCLLGSFVMWEKPRTGTYCEKTYSNSRNMKLLKQQQEAVFNASRVCQSFANAPAYRCIDQIVLLIMLAFVVVFIFHTQKCVSSSCNENTYFVYSSRHLKRNVILTGCRIICMYVWLLYRTYRNGN